MLQVRVAPAGRRWVGGGAQLLLPLLLCGVIAVEPAPLQSHRCCHHLWDEFSSTLRAGRLWEKRGLQRPLYPRRFSALSKSPSLQKPPLTQNLHHTPSFCTHTHTGSLKIWAFAQLSCSTSADQRGSADWRARAVAHGRKPAKARGSPLCTQPPTRNKTNQAPAMFRGDAAHLVDALVAASEWRPAAEGYSGYGRELQPWCPDDAFPMPVEALEAPRCAAEWELVLGSLHGVGQWAREQHAWGSICSVYTCPS